MDARVPDLDLHRYEPLEVHPCIAPRRLPLAGAAAAGAAATTLAGERARRTEGLEGQPLDLVAEPGPPHLLLLRGGLLPARRSRGE